MINGGFQVASTRTILHRPNDIVGVDELMHLVKTEGLKGWLKGSLVKAVNLNIKDVASNAAVGVSQFCLNLLGIPSASPAYYMAIVASYFGVQEALSVPLDTYYTQIVENKVSSFTELIKGNGAFKNISHMFTNASLLAVIPLCILLPLTYELGSLVMNRTKIPQLSLFRALSLTLFSHTLLYPIRVAQTKIQAGRASGMVDTMKDIYRDVGVKGFYAGFMVSTVGVVLDKMILHTVIKAVFQ